MAKSGQIKVRVTDYDQLIFEWSVTSVSVQDNTSTIQWALKLQSTEYGAITSSALKTWRANINGKAWSGQNTIAIGNNTTKNLAGGSQTIAHEYDGTKTFSISFSQQFGITFAGATIGTISKETTATLDPIQRKAEIISAADFTDEGNPSFTYTAIQNIKQLLCNVSWDGIAYISNRDIPLAGSSFTFELQEDERETLREAMANANTMPVTYTLVTVFNDGTTMTSAKNATAKIINAHPRVSATIKDYADVTTDFTGDDDLLIKGMSNAKVQTNVTTYKGASVVSVVLENGTQTKSGTDVMFENVESGTFVVKVTDSRGNKVTATFTKPFVEYIGVTCNINNVEANASGLISFGVSGKFYNANIGSNPNALVVQYCIVEKGATPTSGQFRTTTATASGNTYTAAVNVSGLDYQKEYTIHARAVDAFGVYVHASMDTQVLPLFDWGKDDFQFNVPVNFEKGAQIGRRLIEFGEWTPMLNYTAAVTSYEVRRGWYQKVGGVVTIGWQIKAAIKSGYETSAVRISGVPFTPTFNAFGGGVAHNIYITGGFCFEGWALDTGEDITARLQPCNNTSAGNLQIASTAYYPTGGGTITLAGTICFETGDN